MRRRRGRRRRRSESGGTARESNREDEENACERKRESKRERKTCIMRREWEGERKTERRVRGNETNRPATFTAYPRTATRHSEYRPSALGPNHSSMRCTLAHQRPREWGKFYFEAIRHEAYPESQANGPRFFFFRSCLARVSILCGGLYDHTAHCMKKCLFVDPVFSLSFFILGKID